MKAEDYNNHALSLLEANSEESIDSALKAEKLALEEHNLEQYSYSKFLQGWYFNYRGEFKDSILCFSDSLSHYKKLKNDGMVARVLSSSGYCYFCLGNFEKSMDHLLQAYEIADKLNDDFLKLSVYQNSINVYIENEQPEKALEIMKRCEPIFSENLPVKSKMLFFFNMSYAYLKNNNLKKASDYYFELEKLLEKNSQNYMLCEALRLKTMLLSSKGEINEAKALGLQTLTMGKSAKSFNAELNSLFSLADIYEREANYQAALELLFKSIEVAHKNNSLIFELKAYKLIENIYKKLNLRNEALEYSKKIHDFYNKIYDYNSLLNLELLNYKSEFDKIKSHQKSNNFFMDVMDNSLQLILKLQYINSALIRINNLSDLMENLYSNLKQIFKVNEIQFGIYNPEGNYLDFFYHVIKEEKQPSYSKSLKSLDWNIQELISRKITLIEPENTNTQRIVIPFFNEEKLRALLMLRIEYPSNYISNLYDFFALLSQYLTAKIEKIISDEELHYLKNQIAAYKDEMEALKKDISYQSNHDMKTGLLNIHFLELVLPYLLSQAKRDKNKLLLLILKKDEIFNRTENDYNSYDSLILSIALQLKSQLRKSDYIIKDEIDNFYVLSLHNTPSEKSLVLKNKVLGSVQKIFKDSGFPFFYKLSHIFLPDPNFSLQKIKNGIPKSKSFQSDHSESINNI